MSFFHTTPLGRIINRLTKDTVDADKNLADFAAFFLRSMLQLISTIVLIGIVTPLALPALLPIMLLFYFLYAYFQARLISYLYTPLYAGTILPRCFKPKSPQVTDQSQDFDSTILLTTRWRLAKSCLSLAQLSQLKHGS